MNVPEDLRYTEDHEWAKKRDDGCVVVGITDYAQDALGDITYVELPEVGTEITAGDACGVIESVKTFSDMNAPVDGEIVEINNDLPDNEAVINEAPYTDGWMFVVRLFDDSQWDTLLTPDEYRAVLAEEA